MSSLRQDAREAILELTSGLEGQVEAVILFPAGLDVFKGHFPGQPIVPGILELELFRAAAERLFPGSSFRILSVAKAKFLREIKPGEKVRLTGAFPSLDGKKTLIVKGQLWVENEKAAQVEMMMEKDG
jgi:3-hydroxymyristoyl/3-hydroxydecanoyl-(acyl carrier protein) dehydratase